MSMLLLIIILPIVYTDYKFQKVNVCYVAATLAALIGGQIVLPLIFESMVYAEIMGRILPSVGVAIVFYICCLCSRGRIGTGDGMVLMLFAVVLEVQELLFLLLLSFGMASVVGIVIILLRCEKRIKRVAFVPIMCLAYVMVLIF